MAVQPPRFTLLDVEDGEEYVEDFAAFYYPFESTDAAAMRLRRKGRVRLCTRSLVFEPNDLKFPLLRIPFKDTESIQRLNVPPTSPFGTNELCSIVSKQTIFMKENGTVAPYQIEKGAFNHRFSFPYVSITQFLRSAQEMFDICRSDLVTRDERTTALLEAKEKAFEFDMSWLEDLREPTLLEASVIRVQPLVTTRGRVLITPSRIYLQPLTNVSSEPVLKIRMGAVERVLRRRYLLRHVGVEVFLKDRPSLFLVFHSQRERDNAMEILRLNSNCDVERQDLSHATERWREGKMSNFDYIMTLNEHAGRSFMDLTQYPVFPWIIADYTSPKLDLTSPSSFRDLAKPIGALNAKRLADLRERYRHMPSDQPKFLYGTHYSTPGYVLYFLVRKDPELMLKLQGGRFDSPDRLFASVGETWNGVSNNASDVKELIPEFFMPPGEFLTNSYSLDLGTRQSKVRVGDVELPPWADSARDFVDQNRQALESAYVSERLHQWIDLIFGYKQRGEEADRADNLFYHLTYEGAVDIESVSDPLERRSLERQIQEFGQTPSQLFTTPHPPKRSGPSARETPISPITPITPAVQMAQVLSPKTPTSGLPSSGMMTPVAPMQEVVVWPSFDGHVFVKGLPNHRDVVVDVSIDDTGDRVFSTSKDGTLKVVSITERKQQRSITMPSDMALSSLAIVNNGATAVLGSWDNCVYAYSLEYGRVLDTLTAHEDAVSDVCLRGDFLLSCSWDSSVKLWRGVLSGKFKHPPLAEFMEHDGEVRCIDMNHDATLAVSGGADGTVILWDLKTKHSYKTLHFHAGAVTSVRFALNATMLLTTGDDSTLRYFDVKTGKEILCASPGSPITCAATDGSVAVVGCEDGKIHVMSLVRGDELCVLEGSSNAPVTCLTVSSNGAKVVAGYEDNSLGLWEAASS